MVAEVYFRAGVGMLVVNEKGLVLAAERSDTPGAWQAPQGGLRPDEDAVDAARRELAEETGLDWAEIEVVSEHSEWLGYELPPEDRSKKTGRGQVQKWFLLRYRGGDPAIPQQRDREFDRWQWIPMAQLVDEVWAVRRPIYRRLADTWSDLLGPA